MNLQNRKMVMNRTKLNDADLTSNREGMNNEDISC